MNTITIRRITEPKDRWERVHPIEITGGWLCNNQKLNLSDEQVRLLGGMLALIRDGWQKDITEEWPMPSLPPKPTSNTVTQ